LITPAPTVIAVDPWFHVNPQPLLLAEPGTWAVLEVNDAAVALYGHTREAFRGLRLHDLWGAGPRATSPPWSTRRSTRTASSAT
jgi:hypothetical protein